MTKPIRLAEFDNLISRIIEKIKISDEASSLRALVTHHAGKAGMIGTSLSVVPSRPHLLASKMAVVALIALSAGLAWEVSDGSVIYYRLGDWAAPFGITLVADILSAMMVVLGAGMGLAVAIYSLAEIEEFVWVAAMLVYEERGRRQGTD